MYTSDLSFYYYCQMFEICFYKNSTIIVKYFELHGVLKSSRLDQQALIPYGFS